MNLRRFVETNHFPESKTRPRIQSTSQNPKQQKRVPESKNTSRNPLKHFQESKTLLDSGTYIWILGSVFGFWEVFFPMSNVLPKSYSHGDELG